MILYKVWILHFDQKFMKLCTLQDPNMKMCTLVVYPGPSSFPRIMSKSCVPNMFWFTSLDDAFKYGVISYTNQD
jgi:hypothetical protein